MESQPQIQTRAWPWATALVALAALITYSSAQLSGILVYQRSLIFSGQIWRTWTGHIVHFGPSHLLWDLAVFLPAGCWLERLQPRSARWLYLLCPPLISAVLLAFDPTLERYAGLSGLAMGTLVLLAAVQLQNKKESPWLWLGVLLLVAAKLVLELRQGAPLLVSDFANIRNVPLAHFGGIGCGLFCWLLLGRSRPVA
jgi:rhomboid family GlyGly-CTERM serine protease